MRMGLCILVSVTLAFLAPPARAIDLTAGNSAPVALGDTIAYDHGTLVDLNHPATATGSLTHVQLGWTNSPCAAPGKIKVFHRSGNTLTLAAEESFSLPSAGGPDYSFDLATPLPVHQGDLLGVYGNGSCGNPVANLTPFSGFYLFPDSGDFAAPVTFDPADQQNGGLVIYATGIASEYRAGIIPAVGSGAGLHGANFVTSLQVIAPAIGGNVSGRLVFHPAGLGGSTGDPSLPISISQNHAISFPDVVLAMGQSGFGSIDLVLSPASAVPITFARVFNDQGEAGSSGVGEEMVADSSAFSSSGQILSAGFTGYLSAPVDASKTRFNLGVRTLDSGAFVTFVLKDESGNVKASASSAYPPNYFNQFHAEDLFGMALGSNDVVEVSVSAGRATVFGSTTDTNDPSYQFVHPVFGVV
jgi:hypothetical protein